MSPGSVRSTERRAERRASQASGRSLNAPSVAASSEDATSSQRRRRRRPPSPASPPPPSDPLGLLAELVGAWEGTGYCQVFLPHFAGDARVTGRAYATAETLECTRDVGPVADRGGKRADVFMRGVRYLQTVRDAESGETLHVEPGFWMSVQPAVAAAGAASPVAAADHAPRKSIVRLGTAPHGVAMVLQGCAYELDAARFLRSELGHAPVSPTRASDGALHLEHPATPLPTGMTSRAALGDPNALLREALRAGAARGERLLSAAVLHVQSSAHADGDGISTIPFLRHGAQSALGRDNPSVARVWATFWVERIESPRGDVAVQLQYSQTVVLNFGGVNWPHVSVATLRRKRP